MAVVHHMYAYLQNRCCKVTYQCQVLPNTLSMSHIPTQQPIIALEKLQSQHACHLHIVM